jgi:hypothetical protein
VIKKLIGKVLEIYHQLRDKFLQMVETIRKMNPAYKQPGDGSDGTCDCIGLEIGALRRMGLKWTGIHGSNYAARYQTVNLEYIEDTGQLEKGDIIYKAANEKGIVKLACNAGTKKHAWTLPDRYKKGRAYYDGDLLDYYHVGIVTGVDPLRITHMTSPAMKVDKNLSGGWNYHGKSRPLVEEAERKAGEPMPEPDKKPDEPVPSDGSRAIVTAENGQPVKLRQYPSKSCKTWDKVPCGTEVEIVKPGEEWAEVNCGKRKGWYMMAEFLDVIGDGKGKY